MIHPNGDIIGKLDDEGSEGVLLCDITYDVDTYRQGFPVKMDRKPELYRNLLQRECDVRK